MATTDTDTAATVTDTGRVAVIATYHGPTNYRGTRISVRRADGGGKRIVVPWDYSKNPGENYAAAIGTYLAAMGWEGNWITGATRTGAVATYGGKA